MSTNSCFTKLRILEKNPNTSKPLTRIDEALSLLNRVANQVSPIMKKREWKVCTLVEIIPKGHSLQGYNQNRGQLIALRLRSPENDSSFLSWEHILGTMLHELSHIVVGPHNKEFYKLLDELIAECDELEMRGIKGLGPFECEGYRSGGLRRSALEMKEVMLQRALERQRTASLMGSGRLGGGAAAAGKSARELAADAAERRSRDDAWCGTDFPSGSDQLAGPGGTFTIADEPTIGVSNCGRQARPTACVCGMGCPARCGERAPGGAGSKRQFDGREDFPAAGAAGRAREGRAPPHTPSWAQAQVQAQSLKQQQEQRQQRLEQSPPPLPQQEQHSAGGASSRRTGRGAESAGCADDAVVDLTGPNEPHSPPRPPCAVVCPWCTLINDAAAGGGAAAACEACGGPLRPSLFM